MTRILVVEDEESLARGLKLFEEGRRAFRTRSDSAPAILSTSTPAAGLSAPLGEIAQMHRGGNLSSDEGRS